MRLKSYNDRGRNSTYMQQYIYHILTLSSTNCRHYQRRRNNGHQWRNCVRSRYDVLGERPAGGTIAQHDDAVSYDSHRPSLFLFMPCLTSVSILGQLEWPLPAIKYTPCDPAPCGRTRWPLFKFQLHGLINYFSHPVGPGWAVN